MYKPCLSLIGVLILVVTVSCQQSSESKLGFEIRKPDKWASADKSQLGNNIAKFEFPESTLDRLLNENKGETLVLAYYKYDPKTTPGIIPTIQVRIRPNGTKSFAEFKNAMVRSIQGMSSVFPDISIAGEAVEVSVSGITAIMLTANYTMKSGESAYKIRSRIYAIPKGRYFYQVNFTDEPSTEDCTKEFDDLVKTIKIS